MIRISLLSFFSHLVLNAFGILLFYSEPVVRRISKIHRKLTVTESFFNKVAGRLKKRLPQNSQESTCVRVSVLISRRSEAATLLKKRTWHTCFPVNFGKFLRTPFIMEHLWWLLLSFCYFCLGQGMLMSPVTIGNTDYIDKVFMQA